MRTTNDIWILGISIVVVGIAMLVSSNVRSAKAPDKPQVTPETSVIVLDFTKSVEAIGHDGHSEYEKNCESATAFIGQLAAGSRVVVIGTTDQSFAQPLILLDHTIPSGPGPLPRLDQRTAAKQRIIRELREKCSTLQPTFLKTDMFGAFVLAAEILKQAAGHKILVTFGDARHDASLLDFERASVIHVEQALHMVEKAKQVPDLIGVEVHMLGVHDIGKDLAYWHSLQQFFGAYVQRGHGELKTFTPTRQINVEEVKR